VGIVIATASSMTNLENKKLPSKTPSLKDEQKCSKSKIGREGAGVVGQNWSESPEVARKGRYAEENKIQGDDPEWVVDTDASEAV
jgi:hypothetical protein